MKERLDVMLWDVLSAHRVIASTMTRTIGPKVVNAAVAFSGGLNEECEA